MILFEIVICTQEVYKKVQKNIKFCLYVFCLLQWKHQFMAPVCTALIKPSRRLKLFYTWTLPPACVETEAQVNNAFSSSFNFSFHIAVNNFYNDLFFCCVEVFVPPCINTSEFLHAAMRPDVLTETVVEVSTEDSEPMEVVTVLQEPEMLETEPTKRRKCENIRT